MGWSVTHAETAISYIYAINVTASRTITGIPPVCKDFRRNIVLFRKQLSGICCGQEDLGSGGSGTVPGVFAFVPCAGSKSGRVRYALRVCASWRWNYGANFCICPLYSAGDNEKRGMQRAYSRRFCICPLRRQQAGQSEVRIACMRFLALELWSKLLHLSPIPGGRQRKAGHAAGLFPTFLHLSPAQAASRAECGTHCVCALPGVGTIGQTFAFVPYSRRATTKSGACSGPIPGVFAFVPYPRKIAIPEAPQGRTSPLCFTGSPISFASTRQKKSAGLPHFSTAPGSRPRTGLIGASAV